MPDPMAALWPHVRFDWMFDPTLNSHHLPRTERDRETYAADARQRLAELIAGSQVARRLIRAQISAACAWIP